MPPGLTKQGYTHKRDVAAETTGRAGKAHRRTMAVDEQVFLVSCLSALVPFASFCFLFFYAITILIAIGFESRHNEKLAEMQKTKRAFEEIT